MKSVLHFYEAILTLRQMSSVLYDRGRKQGRTHEELASDLAPLMTQLYEMSHTAVKNDLSSVLVAIKQLESEAFKHEMDAQFLMKKAEDTKVHALNLKNLIKEDLKKNNLDHKKDGDFWITLIDDELTIR